LIALARLSYRPAAFIALAGVMLLFGAWVSFRYCADAWRPDPDIFVTVEVWRGIQRHGPEFLRSWAYTQDNWLLSLVPLSSLAFATFGTSAAVALGIGWVVFLMSVAMTGWIAARLTGWRAGVVLSCVLIFAGYPAVGHAGYLGHPISHNLSMAWALLALALALHSLERGSRGACIAIGFILFIDSVSDPWAGVAIACPMILVTGIMAWVHRRESLGRNAAMLAIAGALGFLTARTQLFGLLSFLPQSSFDVADRGRILLNLYWAGKSLAAIFDILPGDTGSGLADLFNLAILVVLLGSAVALSISRCRVASGGRQLVCGTGVLSIGAMASLFVVGRWDAPIAAGRFFPNLYFLGALLVAIPMADRWCGWRWPPKLALGTYATLFIVAGLTSAPRLWAGPVPAQPRDEALELAGFLQAHGLNYGYGPFWGTRALVADVLTGGRVIIRPVSFKGGSIHRRQAETSGFWYLPADEPTSGRRFLVIRADGEECPSPDACVAMASRQFGTPAEHLIWRNAVILVWPYSIAARITA
jgi:hypothetical protein